MGEYQASAQAAVSNPRTIMTLIAATTKHGGATYWSVGGEATPADNTVVWELLRFSASGTATTVTAALNDPGGAAAALTVKENCTVEPTYTGGEIFRMGVNARSSYTRQYGRTPLRTNVTSDNGIGWRATHASYTGTACACVAWEE